MGKAYENFVALIFYQSADRFQNHLTLVTYVGQNRLYSLGFMLYLNKLQPGITFYPTGDRIIFWPS